MSSIGGLLNNNSLKAIAKISVNIGDVYRIKMDKSNGIVPKKGDTARNKFFVVLGVDDKGNVYGGVIINSHINPNIPPALRDFQMPISPKKYSFLDHNSQVDCSKLMVARIDTFAKWRFLGAIDDEDIKLIKGTIKESPVESREKLKTFGLL